MLILRCAWHRKEFGYAKLLGITWTRSWGVSDGMCRACADVQRARYGLKRADSPSVGREAWRLTVGLTALVAWALVVLLTGCSDVGEPYRTEDGSWQVGVRVFTNQLCGAERPFADTITIIREARPSGTRTLTLFSDAKTLDKIDAECRAGRYTPSAPRKPLGAPLAATPFLTNTAEGCPAR